MSEEIPNEERPPGVRRTLTLRSNSARQVAVNFMPSRQLPYNTLKLRRNKSEHNVLLEQADSEQQVDIIVKEMELHQPLMEDNPESEDLRRDALRDLAQGLTMKRHVRAKLSASVSNRSRSKPISVWKRMKYRISFAWKRFRDRVRNFLFSMELWYEPIRQLEGHLGSAVGSYFNFLRWLFTFDAAMLGLLVCFVIVPQAIHNDHAAQQDTTGGRSLVDFVTGKGIFEDTVLFYGHYYSGNIAPRGPTYNMTFAYFFTMLCVYVVFFGFLCYRTAYSYRHNFIETSGGARHVFANKLFSSWDFGIATREAAQLTAHSIYIELKELLAEHNKKHIAIPRSIKIVRFVTNTIVTTLVVGFIASLGYSFWLLLSAERATRHWDIVVSTVITVVVCVCPVIFSWVVKLEFYAPRTALYVTLARTCLLDIGTMMLLLFFWSKSNDDCWETSFGQEAYRLVLLEAFFSLVALPIFEFLRSFVHKMHPKGTAPEFNIAYNSLTLIYNQVVLWFGMLFSPLLVVAVTLKFLLLFYVKREVALRACFPARKVWRAAQTQTVMYMLVTLSLFITIFGIGILFLSTSSNLCGPFQQYEQVFSVLTEGVLRLSQNAWLRRVLAFLTQPGVIGFLMLLLCVVVYYVRAKSLAQRSMVDILRQMLVIEAKDKDFLLSAIAKVSTGEWMYSPKMGDGAGPADSHTWKYLHDDKVRRPSNADFAFDGSRLNHTLLEGSRPRSQVKDNRPNSQYKEGGINDDGDTDSSFSWQGSSGNLNEQKAKGKKNWL